MSNGHGLIRVPLVRSHLKFPRITSLLCLSKETSAHLLRSILHLSNLVSSQLMMSSQQNSSVSRE